MFMRLTLLFVLLFAKPVLADENALISWSEPAYALDYSRLNERIFDDFSLPIESFVTKQLSLDEPIRIEVSARPYAYYEQSERRVYLPLSNLYRVNDDLQARFPHQPEVQNTIFNTTLQFYFLVELIRAISVEQSLRITGWEAERVDALATIILLNDERVGQDYLLDAAEEFLLIDRAVASIEAQRFKNEFAADEYRLSQVLCIMQAYDAQGIRVASSYGLCQGQYEAGMNFWSKALEPYLQDKSLLKRWLAQPRASQESGS